MHKDEYPDKALVPLAWWGLALFLGMYGVCYVLWKAVYGHELRVDTTSIGYYNDGFAWLGRLALVLTLGVLVWKALGDKGWRGMRPFFVAVVLGMALPLAGHVTARPVLFMLCWVVGAVACVVVFATRRCDSVVIYLVALVVFLTAALWADAFVPELYGWSFDVIRYKIPLHTEAEWFWSAVTMVGTFALLTLSSLPAKGWWYGCMPSVLGMGLGVLLVVSEKSPFLTDSAIVLGFVWWGVLMALRGMVHGHLWAGMGAMMGGGWLVWVFWIGLAPPAAFTLSTNKAAYIAGEDMVVTLHGPLFMPQGRIFLYLDVLDKGGRNRDGERIAKRDRLYPDDEDTVEFSTVFSRTFIIPAGIIRRRCITDMCFQLRDPVVGAVRLGVVVGDNPLYPTVDTHVAGPVVSIIAASAGG